METKTDDLMEGAYGYCAHVTRYSKDVIVETTDDLSKGLEAAGSPSVVWVLKFFRADNYDDALSKAKEAQKAGQGMWTHAAKHLGMKPNNDIIDITPAAERGLATTTASPEWDAARRYKAGAEFSLKVSLALQVMVGVELLKLHEETGVQRGGDRAKPNSLALPWKDRVKAELGISDETARTFMRMAEGKGPEILAELEAMGVTITGRITDVPASQMEAVEQATRKICDGKTQKDMLKELGLLKVADQNAGQPPNNKCLQEWLQKVHPKLAGTTWGHLPKGIRNEFDVAVKKGQAQRHLVNAVTQSEEEVTGATEAWATITGDVQLFTPKLALLPDAELERILGVFIEANNTIRQIQNARRGKK